MTDKSNDDCLKEAFRRNNPSQILVIWPRAAAFAGFLLCVVMSWAFWQYRDGFPWPIGLAVSVIFFVFGVKCGYQFVFPAVIFAADHRGIQIGSGASLRKVVRIGWDQFDSAERGVVRNELVSETARHLSTKSDALRVNFKSSIDADTRYGHAFARFEADRTFVIEEKWLGMSIEEAVGTLNSLAKHNALREG
jgi:hypothetical protein